MKKKLFLLGIVISFFSISTMAQSIRVNLDKLAKDPKTMENAAKADVYIVNKDKKIANKTPESNKSTSAVQSRKKKKN
jgi:hypothetical protein